MSSVVWARVIIVNYNGAAYLQCCVDCLAAQSMPDFEVVIFDNASTDGSITSLRLPDGRFQVRRAGTNIGFAAANNAAAVDCTSRWIATLNPDTRPRSNWLDALRAATQRYPWARVFGSTQLDASDPGRVDGFGDVYCVVGSAWRGASGGAADSLPPDDKEVFAPCAAAALYAREAFHGAGGFDERFFCFLEDVDLGFRLRLRGERCVQVRKAEVLHVGSAIAGRASDFTLYHSHRNRIWLFAKNIPWPLFGPILLLHSAFTLFMLWRIRNEPYRNAVAKGVWAGLLGLPVALRNRQIVQRMRVISSSQVAGMLVWDPRKASSRSTHFLKSVSGSSVGSSTI